MISKAQIDRLIALGRQRGSLEIGDISELLPVDSLSIDEISHVMAVLEDAGISVEIDPAFLTPRLDRINSPSALSPALTPTPGDDAAGAPKHASELASSITNARTSALQGPPPYPRRPATIFVVIGAGVSLIIVLGLWAYFSG